ncbi:MAG: hypothetical protein J1F06_06635, partial [Prevotellaceae bacterium]|nr:hypothetical protein [Prevotellaceae bacterium]
VYCTIDSYDRGGSLTVTGADLPVEHVARSLASYWRIDRQDGGGVKLYNMYYGKYLNFGDKKVNDEGSVFYLVQTSEQSAVGGFALCKNPSISGNDCIDANNYNSGVGNWSPRSGDWQGTTWMIGRMTAADLSEVVKDYIADNYPKAATAADLGVKAEVWDAAVGACDTWAGTESDEDWNGVLAKLAALALDENGVWPVYAIENCSPAYGTGNNIIDDVDGGQPHFRPANTVDDRMLWIVRGAGKVMTVGEYAMVNYHTRKPLRGQEAVSVTPTTDEVQAEGQFLLKLGGNVQHAQESGSLVVTWNNTTTANSASAWRFHYAGTTEELAGYGDIYAEGRALQDAILASAGIKNSVGTRLGQYGNMTAGQYAGLQENAQNVLRGKTPESFDVEAAAEAAASISGLSLNMPKAGQLLRIRSARTDAQPYLGAANSVHKTGRAAFVTGKDGENELATIFYYDGTTLTNLATGYRLRNNSNFVDYNGIVEGTKIGFQAATNGAASKYNVLFNGGARSLYTQKGTANSVDYYFTDAAGGPNTPTGDVAYTFTLEEVESLPVTVTEAGMATLYAPVSLGVPEGVTAYTVTVNESQMLAELSPVENIPAGTGVVLEAEAGMYRFELTEDEAGKIGALEGSVATQSYESGSIYILAQGNGKTGFYRMNSTTDTVVKGCKAYLPAARTAGAPAYIFGRVVTGIAGAEEAESDAAVYGLDGRRVSRMSKGLYIVGGKKVLVK